MAKPQKVYRWLDSLNSSFAKGNIMEEPGLDNRHRDITGRIEKKRSDALNKNLPRSITGFSGNASVGFMRKATGKIGLAAMAKAARNR